MDDTERAVCTHSTPKRLFIFSTQRSVWDADKNKAAHAHMWLFFNTKGIQFLEVQGRYNGVEEKGFLVDAQHVPEEAVLHYCRDFEQDEYMVLDNHKHGTYKASMVNCATRVVRQIGYLRSMPKKDIDLMNMDYTYRPDVNQYFVVWHTDTTQMAQFEKEREERLLSFQRNRPAVKPNDSHDDPFGTPSFA